MGLNDVVKKLESRIDTKLLNLSKVDDFPKPISDFLKRLYTGESLNSRMAATMFNSIFTEDKNTFLMSRNLMGDLLEKDADLGHFKPNSKGEVRRTINDKNYKSFVVCMRNNEIIEVVNEQAGNHAATWKLIDDDVVYYFENKSFFSRIAWDVELDEQGYPIDMTSQYPKKLENNDRKIEKIAKKEKLPDRTTNQENPRPKKDWTFD